MSRYYHSTKERFEALHRCVTVMFGRAWDAAFQLGRNSLFSDSAGNYWNGSMTHGRNTPWKEAHHEQLQVER